MFIASVLNWTHPAGINLSAGVQRTGQHRKFHRRSRKDAFLQQQQQQQQQQQKEVVVREGSGLQIF